jgi:hypothetical protein
MEHVTPEQARAALTDIHRHVRGGRAATLLPAPLVVAVAAAAFANFAARDLPAGWVQNVVMFSPIVVIVPVLLASRIPALAATFGISAAQRESWRLGRDWWLYMTGFLVLLFVNGSVADLPAVETALRVPHTIVGALTAVYIITVIYLWRRRIRSQAR